MIKTKLLKSSSRICLSLLLAILISVVAIPTFASEIHSTTTNEAIICEGLPVPSIPSQYAQALTTSSEFIPLITPEVPGLLSYISVRVSSPCDQYWRSEFPSNWMYMANYCVEEADNFLASTFNIDYCSVAQEAWNNNNTDAYDQYYDVKDNIGKTNNADIMIAFSANETQFGGLGASDGYSLVWYFDYVGISYTYNSVAHESGHMYGVNFDGGCASPCLMSGTPNEICDRCYDIWNSNKYKW